MKIYRVIILFIFLNGTLKSCAQEIVKSSETFNSISDPVIAVYYLPKDNETVRLISIEKDIPTSTKYIENTYFAQYLLFSDGHKFSFQKDEVLKDFKNSFLITRQKDKTNSLNTILKYYYIEKHKLIYNAQLSVRIESQIYLFNNGNVLISDEYEFNGKTFQFYNPNFKLISKNDPLGEDGFKSSAVYEYDNKLIVMIQSHDSDSLTGNLVLEVYDLNSGNKIHQEKCSTKIEDLTSCIGNSEYVIVFADKKLIKINESGKVMWTKKIDWPNIEMIIIKQGSEVVAVVSDKIQSLSSKTGNIRWSKSFNEINSIKNLNFSSRIGFAALGLYTVFNDSRIGVLLALYDRDKVNSLDKYSTSFLIYDLDGINKYEFINTKDNNTSKMNVIENKILIYNENNINIYEKK